MRHVRERHRAARERHRDRGHQLDALRVLGGEQQREEGIVRGLGGDEPVVALRLEAPRVLGNLREVR